MQGGLAVKDVVLARMHNMIELVGRVSRALSIADRGRLFRFHLILHQLKVRVMLTSLVVSLSVEFREAHDL